MRAPLASHHERAGAPIRLNVKASAKATDSRVKRMLVDIPQRYTREIGIHRDATRLHRHRRRVVFSRPTKRRLLGPLERPVFSGCSVSVAYAYAKQRAGEFIVHGFHQDGEHPYWWGRNEGDRVNHRFVIKPAPPSPPLFTDKDGRPRGRPSRHALPTAVTVEAPKTETVVAKFDV
jgi:hypothetical protein